MLGSSFFWCWNCWLALHLEKYISLSMSSLSGKPLQALGGFKEMHVPGTGDRVQLALCLPRIAWGAGFNPQIHIEELDLVQGQSGINEALETDNGARQAWGKGMYLWGNHLRIWVSGIGKNSELMCFHSTWTNSDESYVGVLLPWESHQNSPLALGTNCPLVFHL